MSRSSSSRTSGQDFVSSSTISTSSGVTSESSTESGSSSVNYDKILERLQSTRFTISDIDVEEINATTGIFEEVQTTETRTNTILPLSTSSCNIIASQINMSGANGSSTEIILNGDIQISGLLKLGQFVTPSAPDGGSLGSSSLEWSDLYLADGGIVYFGSDQEIRLIHSEDNGLQLKHVASSITNEKSVIGLTLQTGNKNVRENDIIGKIDFQSPDVLADSISRTICAGIEVIAEQDFTNTINSAKISFKTGGNDFATEKMFLTSSGSLTISNDLTVNGNDIYFGNGTRLSNASSETFYILAVDKTIDIDSADMRIDLTGSQFVTIIGNKTLNVNNVVKNISGTKTVAVGGNTAETYSGNRTVMLNNDANDSLTIAGNKTLAVTGNQTDTISGTKTVAITGNVEEILSAEKKLQVANKTDETYSGNRTVMLNNDANDSLTIAGNKTLAVTGNQTDTISGTKTVAITGNVEEILSAEKKSSKWLTKQMKLIQVIVQLF